ncbi:helix-turn-helix domain-containing protein [Herbaspirillum sp. RV1423]|uniref:winged helix-turn-helix transcriptional regulator n=1 Tax=Herbaspirillum sp. RV1423 TaxID=1443993 RepID=UPI0004AF6BDB|nr:helix-turn-helix domain-containing protein [Herbaspirillum sp. RV1423]
MRHKCIDDQECPIACTLQMVGEWWSILILRDCLRGLSRFDQFQKNLAISPNMLARRLQTLIDAGLLERRQYREHPPRYEYILTDRGRDFHIVIAAMYDWGNRNLPYTGAGQSGVQHVTAQEYLEAKNKET